MDMNIAILKQLDVERKKREHPNLAMNNPEAITPYAYKQNSANGLTRCIIDAINLTGGLADIDAFFNGVNVKIEVKYGNDRMSDAQKKYKENIERVGGVYIVARNLEDFWIEWTEKTKQKFKR